MLCEEKGRDYPILSLVDDAAKISDIYNPINLASKAQCLNIRTFTVHHQTGYMYEIKLGGAMPISNGPLPY